MGGVGDAPHGPVTLLGCVSSTRRDRGPIADSYISASASSDGAGTGASAYGRSAERPIRYHFAPIPTATCDRSTSVAV
jgi:hypothetical protein